MEQPDGRELLGWIKTPDFSTMTDQQIDEWAKEAMSALVGDRANGTADRPGAGDVELRPPAVALTGSEITVEFTPGQEFAGPVDADQLRTKLRLSHAAAPLDLMETPLTVWLNGDLIDIDDLITVLDDDGAPDQFASASAAEAAGSIERYGRWLREVWPEVSEDLTLLPVDCDFTDFSLDWAAATIWNWLHDGLLVDIDIDSPLLSATNAAHLRALREAAGEDAHLVALNGVSVGHPPNATEPGAPDAG